MTTKVVVLAAGRGTRMRAPAATNLSSEQTAAADAGEKGMIPIGRPFLDYALSAYADAGLTDVCLIVSPGPTATRVHYERIETQRLSVSFAVQEKPIGVANAVLAAREFVGDDDFIIVNGDNYYPTAVMQKLAASSAPALPAFSRDGLLRDGQIAAERIAAYALLDIAPDGTLRRIVEKPNAEQLASMQNAAVSLNCWLFTPEIFAACEQVHPSVRGELELPDAVQLAIDQMGMRFHTFAVDSPVLDLSNRGDIPSVAARLASVSVRL